MFRRKSNKPKGLHISDPILLPSPNPELPIPPTPRPFRPGKPWGEQDESQTLRGKQTSDHADEDEERDSQTLLDVVNEYQRRETLRQMRSETHDGDKPIPSTSPQQQAELKNFQNFVRDLQREAASATPALAFPHNHAARLPNPMQALQIKQELPLAEKILRKVARGPDQLQEQRDKHQLNLAEKRFHQPEVLAGDVDQGGRMPEDVRPGDGLEDEEQDVEGDVDSVYPDDDEARTPKPGRPRNIYEDGGLDVQQDAASATRHGQEARLPKPARPQNIQEVWDSDSRTATGPGSPEPSPSWSHITPLSPNPNPNHSPRLPRTYPPQHDIRSSAASSPSSESTIDWNEIRFSTFARRTIAAFARNGRKRGYDPNDLITYEDMHRKKGLEEIAAETAAAEALRDDPEQNERRFGLAWEWLNANSRKNESLGEAVVKLSRKREREDKGRAGDAGDRATRVGDLMREM